MIPIAAAMLACPNLAMPAQLMYHVAEVESNFNPFAIGVVGGRLLRQPESLDEAVATAQMLEAHGYDFSLGLVQVNRANLKKYGLDTYAKAFGICDNLAAGSRILAQCYASAGGAWGKAFSCYYAGDYTTGFRDGYVQKIFAAFKHGFGVAPGVPTTDNAVARAPRSTRPGVAAARALTTPHNSAAYRVAIRSVAMDAVAEAAVVPLAKRLTGHPANATPEAPATSAALARGTMLAAAGPNIPASAVFRPQVTGPNDAALATATGDPMVTVAPGRAAVIQQSTPDDAFVF